MRSAGADQRQPLCALPGPGYERAPSLLRLVATAVLLGAEPEIILRHHVFGIGSIGALEQALCLRGDHAVGSHHHRFAKIPQARGVRTEYLQCVPSRPHGIIEASKAKIDRRQQFPAPPVLGIALQIGLDLGDGFLDSGRQRLPVGCRVHR